MFEMENFFIKIIAYNETSRIKLIFIILKFIKITMFLKSKKNNNEDKLVYEDTPYYMDLINMTNSKDSISQFKPVYTEYKDNSYINTDIKVLAWYLPQFYPFKENNEWWGEGFTEWTNVKKAVPLYDGHCQPRIPHKDIGYYNLSNIDNMRKQVEIAKNYGLYGFCFYHYDFAGKRIMEKPVDNYINNKDINFNFCLSYANENWTRKWDGGDNHLLIGQVFSKENDLKFIENLQKYFDDYRYIKIDDKPVLLVYRPLNYPNINETTNIWREYQLKHTGKDLYLIFTCAHTHPQITPKYFGFDSYVDFSIRYGFAMKRINGYAISYEALVNAIIKYQKDNEPSYKDVFLRWDNSPRTKNCLIVDDFSFDTYRKWIRHNIEYTRKNFEEDRRFMFINAWNEWGEGTYLEPDKDNGYTALDILSQEIIR